jgi:hypothetical protein
MSLPDAVTLAGLVLQPWLLLEGKFRQKLLQGMGFRELSRATSLGREQQRWGEGGGMGVWRTTKSGGQWLLGFGGRGERRKGGAPMEGHGWGTTRGWDRRWLVGGWGRESRTQQLGLRPRRLTKERDCGGIAEGALLIDGSRGAMDGSRG